MSALPVPSPSQQPDRPTRGGRKPVRSDSSARPRSSKNEPASVRPFAGKQFVGFETSFLEAIYHGASSLSELKLILLVAKLANDREIGNPFGRTTPIMPVGLADEIGCSTQNIRCSKSVWFYDDAAAKAGQPTGLIERFERKAQGKARKADGDARAFEFQIRADYVETWARQREDSRRKAEELKRQQEADRQAALAEAAENGSQRRKSWKSTTAVKVGPKTPFRLPDDARELIRENCSAITAKREGTIKGLGITAKGVLEFDFEPAPTGTVEPSEAVSSPPKNSKIRKSTCAFPQAVVDNKELTKSRRAKLKELRDDLDRRLMSKIGMIDDVIFKKVVDQLGGPDALTKPRVAELMNVIQGSVRKIQAWPFLVTPSPATKKSLVMMARAADERKAELGYDAAAVDDIAAPEEDYFERAARREREKDGGPNG